MDNERLKILLEHVTSGHMPVEEALNSLRSLTYDDMGYAKLHMHRGIRTGFPEVVFCQGKTCGQSVEIVKRLAGSHSTILATRVAPDVAEKIAEAVAGCTYHSDARILVVNEPGEKTKKAADDSKYIMILCAGTADLPVVEEAAITAESMGSRVMRSYDVGVGVAVMNIDNGFGAGYFAHLVNR